MPARSNDTVFESIVSDVANYYDARLAEHGTTARGVDWNSTDSQLLRFAQLSKILPDSGTFSINDVGCGYGAYFDFLQNLFPSFSYRGFDISSEMIAAARKRFGSRSNVILSNDMNARSTADYGVASGIFNVRLMHTQDEWFNYVVRMLDVIANSSRVSFAFNCLTSYSEPGLMLEHLYYANPGEMFDLCKRRYSRQVALLHDYGLYEFTILVRKEA